jgi:hypothetical protein
MKQIDGKFHQKHGVIDISAKCLVHAGNFLQALSQNQSLLMVISVDCVHNFIPSLKYLRCANQIMFALNDHFNCTTEMMKPVLHSHCRLSLLT